MSKDKDIYVRYGASDIVVKKGTDVPKWYPVVNKDGAVIGDLELYFVSEEDIDGNEIYGEPTTADEYNKEFLESRDK
jgi:hypothetical protein|tara:strand:+ start:6380 stop:6610 length:231 start_codon:yes stop_codon:yes gene_type:complete